MTDAVAALTGTPDPAASAPAPPAGTPPAPAPQPDPNAASTPPAPEALTLPGKEATTEEWAAFYAKIGKPETPDGYEIKPDEGSDGSFEKEAVPLFHKANLTKDQAAILHKGYNEMRQNALAQIAKNEEAAAAAAEVKNKAEATQLQQEWGDKHGENLEMAKRAVNQFFPKEQAGDVVAAIESKIGYAATIKLMQSIGKGLGEHGAPGLGVNNGAQPVKDVADSLFPTTAKK